MSVETQREYKWTLAWRCIFVLSLVHLAGLYGIYLAIVSAQWKTLFFTLFLIILAVEGVTAGAHRYYAHRSYKAVLPLQILLLIFQTLSMEKHAYYWASIHRVHHKYVDTDADPHNSRRGLFFSHIGWLMLESEPEFDDKISKVDLSDLHNDKLLMFQKKYYYQLMVIIGILIPAAIPWYFWGESIVTSFVLTSMTRFMFSSHFSFTINSFAHTFGTKPYDKSILPTENLMVSVLALGEGWHNYHHVFPWDYKTSEFSRYNVTAAFIKLMAAIGWAYDLKTTSKKAIITRVTRTGDGSRKIDNLINGQHEHEGAIWGWGDKDMTEEDFSYAKISNSKN